MSGLAATVRLLHTDGANDRLDVAGTDNVVSAGLAAGAIQLFAGGVLVP